MRLKYQIIKKTSAFILKSVKNFRGTKNLKNYLEWLKYPNVNSETIQESLSNYLRWLLDIEKNFYIILNIIIKKPIYTVI